MSSNQMFRLSAIATTAILLLTSCSGSSVTSSSGQGGTLYILSSAKQIAHLDPQRNYLPEDLAFASGYLNRTLTQYTVSDNASAASNLVGDLATDIGTVSNGGKSWSFNIRDGIKWQDGSAVTCEDVKYGVSRTFATDTFYDGYLYAISLLDIPKKLDGTSKYAGPYKKDAVGQGYYDQAVHCDGNRITFNLSIPSYDFNYTVSLSAFAPVEKSKDTRNKYDQSVQSSGPYMISGSSTNSKMILVRNPHWDANTDAIRKAYPDRIEYDFSIQQSEITKRLIRDSGRDQFAISPDAILDSKVDAVFSGAQFAQRRFNELNPYFTLFAINTKKVPNLKQRQAILAGIDRQSLRTLAGGPYIADYADGFLKPNIGQDYAPTGLWDGLLGEKVPATGNVSLARKLIKESGRKFPNPLVFDYTRTPTNDKIASILRSSLARVGIVVKPHGVQQGDFYSLLLNPAKQGGLSFVPWGSDWQNAATVIPELFTPSGGLPLTQYADKAWIAQVAAAKNTADRAKQAKLWQALNKEAVRLALGCPNQFGRQQRLVGSKITGAFIWSPYSSWPYATLGLAH